MSKNAAGVPVVQLVAQLAAILSATIGGGGGGGGKAEAGGRSFSSPAKPFASSQRCPVVVRLKAVATGSQSAVVKVASYGGGIRIGSMVDYVSREGDLSLENGRGERL